MNVKGNILILAALLLSIQFAPVTTSAIQCGEAYKAPELSWGHPLFNFELAESTLLNQKQINKMLTMHDFLQSQGKKTSGTSEVYYVEFPNGLKAVWKPDADIWGPFSEQGAYFVARRLGIKVFTPTLVTEIDGRMGTISLFVQTPIDLVGAKKERRAEILSKIPKKQWADMEVVHYLLGQWDRHTGNILVDANYNLVVIDNEVVSTLGVWRIGESPFTRMGTLPNHLRTRFDQKNKTPFPYDKIQYLDGNNPDSFASLLEQYLVPAQRLHPDDFEYFQNKQMPYVVWRDSLWRQRPRKSLGTINLHFISFETLEALRKMTEADFRSVLDPRIFSDQHIEFIMQRRLDILERAKTALIML